MPPQGALIRRVAADTFQVSVWQMFSANAGTLAFALLIVA
jgi:sarcosine oxidase gamma subunit